MSSTQFQSLLEQLAAEHERIALSAGCPPGTEKEERPRHHKDTSSLRLLSHVALEIEGASPGPGQELVHSKDEALADAVEQLVAATRKLAVALASMALQQALGELEGMIDLVFQAETSQRLSAAGGAADVREEKLASNTEDVAQQAAQKCVDEVDDAIMKAKLNIASEPEPEREYKAGAGDVKSPVAKELAKPPKAPSASPTSKTVSASKDRKAQEPPRRAEAEDRSKVRAVGAVFDSKAAGGTREEAEREEYYQRVLDKQVVHAPVPGSGRPDGTAEAAGRTVEEVVRYANSDVFGDVVETLPDADERSLEDCVARGLRYCRGAGYGGFRVVQRRVQLFSRTPNEIEAAKKPFVGHTLVVVRRPQRMQSKLTIVPMGQQCATAIFLKQAGWRRQAFPLDRSCHTLQVWDHMLADDYRTLLAERGPKDGKRHHPYNKMFGDCAMFLHQEGWSNDDVRRRVERLRAVLREKSAFGLAMYFEGRKNIHATQQEVLSWAKRVAKPERGFQHVVLVWFEGEAAEPSGKWRSISERLTLLRYTPRVQMDYKKDVHIEDVLKLSSLLEARFPEVFTGFREGPPDATALMEAEVVSEKDVDEGPEDVDDIWDDERGRFRDLEPEAEEPKTAGGKQKVILGLEVSSRVDRRKGKVVELPWRYSNKDFFMVRFGDTGNACPRPVEKFRTRAGRPLTVDKKLATKRLIGTCQDCRLQKCELLDTKVGNAAYCISCWCKEWMRWD